MTHTPGPYTVRHKYNVFADERLIANTGGHSDNQNQEQTEQENQDNARLLASAPEMLEALNACADVLEDVFDYIAPRRGRVIYARNLALAAISSAKPEAE